MVFQRYLCGAIGLLLLVSGVVLLSSGASSNPVIASAAIRAGSLLMVTWLAWPKLFEWRQHIPRVALVALALLGLILVARPSWGKIAGMVTVVAIAGSLVSRWLASIRSNG